MIPELSPEDRELRGTVGWELTNSGNYPHHVAVQVLGTDMTSIIDAVFNALKDEGYVKPQVPTVTDLALKIPDPNVESVGLEVLPEFMGENPPPSLGLTMYSPAGLNCWGTEDRETIKSLIQHIAALGHIPIAIGE